MSIEEDVIAPKKTPTHLNCPYCPAQSYPSGVRSIGWDNTPIRMYQCPAKHRFYIEE